MKIKNIHVFAGGTVAHISNHFAVCAPAYGATGQELMTLCQERFISARIIPNFTRMAAMGHSKLETNEDVAARIEELKKDPNTKVIFFNCALVDYNPILITKYIENIRDDRSYDFDDTTSILGKYEQRLNTRENPLINIECMASDKIISNIRTGRKDIFLVGFKTTCGASKQEMYEKGLRLCKESSVNLVLVNDTKTRFNMIVCPEEAVYCETHDRDKVLKELVDMAFYRSQLTFVQSTVVDGNPVSWHDNRIPDSLRKVVNHCISKRAYKPFNNITAGHFAIRLSDTEFITSIRKTNLNDLEKIGMVYIRTDKPDTVLAYGAKPSVGGQSQRVVFKDHPGFDAIVHFHSPLKENHRDNIPIASQRNFECGSIECGTNTSNNLGLFCNGKIKAVMLDNHGPNIVFNKDIDPNIVIDFIEANFDLDEKTGGYKV